MLKSELFDDNTALEFIHFQSNQFTSIGLNILVQLFKLTRLETSASEWIISRKNESSNWSWT